MTYLNLIVGAFQLLSIYLSTRLHLAFGIRKNERNHSTTTLTVHPCASSLKCIVCAGILGHNKRKLKSILKHEKKCRCSWSMLVHAFFSRHLAGFAFFCSEEAAVENKCCMVSFITKWSSEILHSRGRCRNFMLNECSSFEVAERNCHETDLIRLCWRNSLEPVQFTSIPCPKKRNFCLFRMWAQLPLRAGKSDLIEW